LIPRRPQVLVGFVSNWEDWELFEPDEILAAADVEHQIVEVLVGNLFFGLGFLEAILVCY